MNKAKVAWAGFWGRVGAFLIDAVLIGLIGNLIGFANFDRFAALGDDARIVGLVLAVGYFGLFGSSLCGGQTLGMKLCKLRLVNLDGRPLSLGVSFARALVLAAPFVLNGLYITYGASIAQNASAVLLITILFGVGLAQTFLLFFNRPSRRLLHDLMFRSCVVSATRPMPEMPPPNAAPKVAFGIIGVVFLLAILSPFVSIPWMTSAQWASNASVTSLIAPLNAVRALPEAAAVNIQDSTSRSYFNGNGPVVSRALIVTVRLRSWPATPALEVARIGGAAQAAYRLAPGQHLRVNLNYGFTLGFASGWKSFAADYVSSSANRARSPASVTSASAM